MSRTSKSTSEEDGRVNTVRESDRSSKRRHPSNTDSDMPDKKVRLDSSTSGTDAKDHKEMRSEQKSPSRREKRESSRRHHEKDADKKKEKRAHSPANRESGTSSSNFEKPSEVSRKSKEANALEALKNKRKTRESKKQRKERSPSRSARGKTTERPSRASKSSKSRSFPSHRDYSPKPVVKKEQITIHREVGSVKQLNPVVITRNTLARLLYTPFFKKTVIGCYVRLARGPVATSQLQYIIWKIVDVEELNVIYHVDDKPTNLCIKCQCGTEERTFRMKFVSNAEANPIEFVDWLVRHKSIGAVPTVDTILKKEMELRTALRHRYHDDEVEEMVKTKQQYQKGPVKFVQDKVELLNRKALALQSGEVEDATSIQSKIDEIDAESDKLNKQRTKASGVVALINQRNRAEKRKQVVAEPMETTAPGDDPFSRKKGFTRVVTGKKSTNKDVTAPSLNEDAAEVAPPAASEPQLPPAKIVQQEPVKMSNYHNADLDLDIDISKLMEIDNDIGLDFNMDQDFDINFDFDFNMDLLEASPEDAPIAPSSNDDVSGPTTSANI